MSANKTALSLSTLALTLGFGTAVQAKDEIALSFALSPKAQDDVVTAPVAASPTTSPPEAAPAVEQAAASEAIAAIADAPLPVPPGAENPPLSGDTTWPAGVYGGIDALALDNSPSVEALLPAPPPAPAPRPTPATVAATPPPVDTLNLFPPEEIDDLLALSLDLKPRLVGDAEVPVIPEPAVSLDTSTVAVAHPHPQPYSWDSIQSLFDGGTDSLVARAVGSAEGTRTPEGHKNPAYFGHTDPGNQVWNLGTFSYQHGASTPEEADAKQLKRLQQQTKLLSQKAQDKGLMLSPEELLNGIDLANQAPLAALDRGGYIDWLQEAQALGMTGAEAIVWARTRSFIDPDTQRWNAPGLGNNIYSIAHDQERRANAIARAMNVTGFVAPIVISAVPIPSLESTAPPEPAIAIDVALNFEFEDSFMQAPSAIAQNEALDASLSAATPASSPISTTPDLESPELLTLEADSSPATPAATASATALSVAAVAPEAAAVNSETSSETPSESTDAAVPEDMSAVASNAEPLQFAEDALETAIVPPAETEGSDDAVADADIEDVEDELPELPAAWQPATSQALAHEADADERAEMADIASAIISPEPKGNSTADIAAARAITGTAPEWLSGTESGEGASSGFSPPVVMAPMLQLPAENFTELLEAEKANAEGSKSQPLSALSETLKSLEDFQKNEL
ncbi:MAG: hypothetical protein AAFR26_09585 [Cyanobacteria bacterium J06626_4]